MISNLWHTLKNINLQELLVNIRALTIKDIIRAIKEFEYRKNEKQIFYLCSVAYVFTILFYSLGWISLNWIGNIGKHGICSNPKNNTSYIDCNYKNENFQGRELRDIDFSNSDFQGANFKDAVLFNVNFHGSNLNHVNFENSIIMYSNFVETCLVEANFGNAKIHNVNHWRGAAFINTILKGTSLEENAETLAKQFHRNSCDQVSSKKNNS